MGGFVARGPEVVNDGHPQIVDAHGGKLTVESLLGEGTTFSITLPVRTGPRPRRRSTATTAVDASA
mgnify:CR=1 FL=1